MFFSPICSSINLLTRPAAGRGTRSIVFFKTLGHSFDNFPCNCLVRCSAAVGMQATMAIHHNRRECDSPLPPLFLGAKCATDRPRPQNLKDDDDDDTQCAAERNWFDLPPEGSRTKPQTSERVVYGQWRGGDRGGGLDKAGMVVGRPMNKSDHAAGRGKNKCSSSWA